MSTVAIVAVEYLEPEYAVTRDCILDCKVPVVWVDRQGTGSLAEAYNKGFVKSLELWADYVWFVSNPTFKPEVLPALVKAMDGLPRLAAIHPAFDSDHAHLQPKKNAGVLFAPYIEFTAPLVRTEVFLQHPLDGKMPYWGHDLDWSYRVKQAGYELAVYHGVQLQHTYIRNAAKHPITKQRHQLRKQANASTTQRLEQLYGKNWREVLGYFG